MISMCKIIRKITGYLLAFVVFSFLVWFGYLFIGGRDPVILMYHSVGENLEKESILNVSEEAFEDQMSLLKKGGYHVVSLMDLVQMIECGKRVPFKTVVITFDDGYENNYAKAYPILRKYHFPAIIFMITGNIGQEKEMAGGHRYRFLSKEMLRTLSNDGLMSIGAHTVTHPYLPDVSDPDLLEKEISGSKEELENIIKKPVEAFAYPVGGYNEAVLRCIKKAGFKVALTTLPLKKNRDRFDLFTLKRIKMTEKARKPFVFFIETSGYYIRMKEMHT